MYYVNKSIKNSEYVYGIRVVCNLSWEVRNPCIYIKQTYKKNFNRHEIPGITTVVFNSVQIHFHVIVITQELTYKIEHLPGDDGYSSAILYFDLSEKNRYAHIHKE